MFHRTPYRLQVWALKIAPDISGHPEITSKPKYECGPGDVYVSSVLSRILLMMAALICRTCGRFTNV